MKIADDPGMYSCESKQETVKVMAGEFNTIRVDLRLEFKEQKVSSTYWFAENVGIVKQTAEVGGLNLVSELEKFERAAAPKKEKVSPKD